jgi:hypothetical protein
VSALTLAQAGKLVGFAVVSGTIHLPRVGAWTADLRVSSDTPLTGKVEVRIGDSLTLAGSVSRGAVHEGFLHAAIVGGAAGLRSSVKPKHYTSPTLRIVLQDVLGDVGEALAASADAGILGTQFEHWTSLAMPAGQAVRLLLEHSAAGGEVAWRHLPDGTLWVGRESWPTSNVADVTPVAADPVNDTIEVSMVSPEVLPGTVVAGRKVDEVEVRFSGAGVAATLWVLP